jgi:glycosyltransferase involved in cell wall biosynthesis
MKTKIPKIKLNVWSISHYACPPEYSYGTGHHFLAKNHVKNGHNVTIFASSYNHYMNNEKLPSSDLEYERIDGVKYVWIKSCKYNNPHSLKRVINWIFFVVFFFLRKKNKFGKPDIVIMSSHSLVPIICAIWAKYRFKSKIILEIRDVWPATFVELGGKSKYHPLIWFLNCFEIISYRWADHIVSTLPNIVKRVGELAPYKTSNVTIIPQGMPEEVFNSGEKLDKNFVNKYFSGNEFRVMYAGAIGPSNALDTLIECAKIMKHNYPKCNVRFFILGEGLEKESLVKQSEGFSNIIFIPRISRSLVQDFLSYGHLFYDSVRSSKLYDYGLSRQKWMDYMFGAKPILASYSGFKSLINEANCGEFVEAENSQTLLDRILFYTSLSKDELEEVGKRGREYLVENRSFQKLAFQYESLFQKIKIQ